MALRRQAKQEERVEPEIVDVRFEQPDDDRGMNRSGGG
jgi:hypothetical protein